MILISVFYLLAQLVLVIGFIKLLREILPEGSSTEISVVTAAKNEVVYIESLINSVRKVNYPDGKFEMIIIDDRTVSCMVRPMFFKVGHGRIVELLF